MLLTAIILIIVLGAVFDFVRVLLLYALVWLAPIGVAMATLQMMLAYYPDDPSMIFFAVVIAVVVTRVLIEALAVAVRRARA
ncbi:MAG: hypothetical protein JNL81_16035 [Hyphomonadaceae bacterium]|nr:hypothetical protein [Hyphomonadaceae bacterium]